jgi:hypothetical protein
VEKPFRVPWHATTHSPKRDGNKQRASLKRNSPEHRSTHTHITSRNDVVRCRGYSTPKNTATPFRIHAILSPLIGKDNCVSTDSRSMLPYTGEMYAASGGIGGGASKGAQATVTGGKGTSSLVDDDAGASTPPLNVAPCNIRPSNTMGSEDVDRARASKHDTNCDHRTMRHDRCPEAHRNNTIPPNVPRGNPWTHRTVVPSAAAPRSKRFVDGTAPTDASAQTITTWTPVFRIISHHTLVSGHKTITAETHGCYL